MHCCQWVNGKPISVQHSLHLIAIRKINGLTQWPLSSHDVMRISAHCYDNCLVAFCTAVHHLSGIVLSQFTQYCDNVHETLWQCFHNDLQLIHDSGIYLASLQGVYSAEVDVLIQSHPSICVLLSFVVRMSA